MKEIKTFCANSAPNSVSFPLFVSNWKAVLTAIYALVGHDIDLMCFAQAFWAAVRTCPHNIVFDFAGLSFQCVNDPHAIGAGILLVDYAAKSALRAVRLPDIAEGTYHDELAALDDRLLREPVGCAAIMNVQHVFGDNAHRFPQGFWRLQSRREALGAMLAAINRALREGVPMKASYFFADTPFRAGSRAQRLLPIRFPGSCHAVDLYVVLRLGVDPATGDARVEIPTVLDAHMTEANVLVLRAIRNYWRSLRQVA
ncbi:MAG: DUF3825 domain-containing protein [Kiritimatiellae bacterium]|nr:DUF3825 domain-containing protein [Kiritimatiellia bacterium]